MELFEMFDVTNIKRIEVSYLRGTASIPSRKTFKNQSAFEKWFEKNEGNIGNVMTREVEV
jgi:hypothetical protein